MTNIIRSVVFAFITISIFSINLNAQKTFGVKGGVNLSDFYDHPESDMITGLSLGFFKNFDIYNSLYLSLGLYYSTEGAYVEDIIYNSNGTYYSGDFFIHQVDLEMQVNLGYQFNINRNLNFKPYLGWIYTVLRASERSEISNSKEIGLTIPGGSEYFTAFPDNNETNQKGGISLGLELEYNNLLSFDVRYSRFFGAILTAGGISGIDYRIHYVNFSLGIYLL